MPRPRSLVPAVFATLVFAAVVLAAFPALAQTQVSPADYTPDRTYTLTTGLAEGKMVFLGVGGAIDGVVNPTLHAEPGDVVQLTLVDGDGVQHDWNIEGSDVRTDPVMEKGAASTTAFRVGDAGVLTYFCSVPGHRQAGMEGRIEIGQPVADVRTPLASVVHDPADVPEPVGARGPMHHDLTLRAEEVDARLADGTAYRFWTFDGTVPGPMLRIRVGDTVTLTLENAPDSTMIHSVDLHAVTGPGGGAAVLQTAPGDASKVTFRALKPGLFVYHCATPMVAQHIANGMYGMILVEPEGGLAPVDREFYVMQGEIYTEQAFGTPGAAEFSVDKLLDEHPEYYVFNGGVGSLTTEAPLQASVGDTVRIFFGVGGPNATSSFHVIGEIFDRVYNQASFTSAPLTDVQTTTVAPGGATMVEFSLEVPGRYILVDHALSRLERGLVGFLFADGPDAPDIFRVPAASDSTP